MGKSKNPSIDYTFGDRFKKFITKIVNFAIRARSNSEIDTSPQDIFDGEQGELLTKFKNKIFYRKNDSSEFISLSDEYQEITRETEYTLSTGINKYATWTKTSPRGRDKDWELVGYFCPINDVDCCITGAYGV